MEYGNAASGLREYDLAAKAWSTALDLDPHNSDLVGLIGHQYQVLRQPDKAAICFKQAAAANPRGINPRISLAVLLEKSHQLGEARAVLDECLAINARDEQARYLSATLDRREGKLESAETRLRDLMTSNPTHHFVHYACRYELAEVLNQTERYDEAMAMLGSAKDLQRRLTDTERFRKVYEKEADEARRITRGLGRTTLLEWRKLLPEKSRETIPPLAFLGGHPRSGTTLIEQILDAHPGVTALDEPTAFPDILQPNFSHLGELSAARINVLRRLYIKALRWEAGPVPSGSIFLDKNPSPTARLPLWLRIFPELRVIIALRDPRDVVLSCYFQNLQLNPTSVNFLSFEGIAKHYADLMDVWLAVREWEGLAWMETRYEDTVTDMRKEGGRVTEFLGLDWDQRQEQFHEKSRKKQLYSPTYQDVTQPVYSRSVARWHAYAKHLEPVLPALAPYCRAFGYGDAGPQARLTNAPAEAKKAA